MKLGFKSLGFIIAIVIFGGILGASALGLWNTKSIKSPSNIKNNESINANVGENVGTGSYSPADIRGSHSFGEISELFDIPLETLCRAFALPADVDLINFINQDFETIYPQFEGEQEIGNGSMKWFVALYTGLPFGFEDDEEATYLLRPAVDILMSHSELTVEQIAYLDAHIIDMDFEEVEYDLPDESQHSEVEEIERKQDAMVVAGKTTFADLLDWGIPSEKIESIIGNEIPNRLTLVYDYCVENGLSFGNIKSELQVEVDALD